MVRDLILQKGHSGSVYALAISPDGTTLATAGGDSTIRIWDINSGECLKILRGHGADYITFRLNGKRLVCYGLHDTFVWDLLTGEHFKYFKTVKNPFFEFFYNFYIESSKYLGNIHHSYISITDLETGSEIFTKDIQCYYITISNNGNYIALVEDFNNKIEIIDIRNNLLINRLDILNTGGNIAFDNTNSNLILYSENKPDVYIVNIFSGEIISTFQNYEPVSAIYKCQNSETLAIISSSKITFWKNKEEINLKKINLRGILSIKYSKDESKIALCCTDRILVYSIFEFEPLKLLELPIKKLDNRLCDFMPDSNDFAILNEDGVMEIWDLKLQKIKNRIAIETNVNRIKKLAIDNYGKCLALLYNNPSSIELWDLENFIIKKTVLWAMLFEEITLIALSNNGRYIAYHGKESHSGNFLLYDINNDDHLYRVICDSPINMQFNSTGEMFAIQYRFSSPITLFLLSDSRCDLFEIEETRNYHLIGFTLENKLLLTDNIDSIFLFDPVTRIIVNQAKLEIDLSNQPRNMPLYEYLIYHFHFSIDFNSNLLTFIRPEDKSIDLYDLKTLRLHKRFHTKIDIQITLGGSIFISPNKSEIIFHDKKGDVYCINIIDESISKLINFSEADKKILIGYVNDGKYLGFIGDANTFYLYDLINKSFFPLFLKYPNGDFINTMNFKDSKFNNNPHILIKDPINGNVEIYNQVKHKNLDFNLKYKV